SNVISCQNSVISKKRYLTKHIPHLTKHIPSLTKHIPHLDLPSDETVRRYNFERNFTTKLSDKKSWEREPTTQAFKENTIKWYTDGSKTNKGTGARVYGSGTKYFEALGIN